MGADQKKKRESKNEKKGKMDNLGGEMIENAFLESDLFNLSL